MFAFYCGASYCTEYPINIIDGLGKPVPDATVEIYWLKSVSKDDVRRVDIFRRKSDKDGRVAVQYDEKLIPPNEYISIEIGKRGYKGYSDSQRKPVYVLRREIGSADLDRVVGLAEAARPSELREVLAGELKDDGERLQELVFFVHRSFAIR